MTVALVGDGHVVEHILLALNHLPRSVVKNYCNLMREGWIVGAARWDGRCNQLAAAVLMLETFTTKGGATGGCPNPEGASALVRSGPDQGSDSLELVYCI